jgi:simple sugar transport system permease protein
MSESSTVAEVPVLRAEGSAAPRKRRNARWLQEFSLIPVIGILLLIGFIESPNFLTTGNMTNVLQQSTELSLVVLGEALILISGRMDLSLESTVGLAPVVALWVVMPSHGTFNSLGFGAQWMAIPICLLVGAAIGALNGFLILKMKLNGFVVTLGMLTTLRGLITVIDGGQSIFTMPSSFQYLGHTEWGGVPASVWICGLLFAIGIGVLGWYRHGRALYAIGGNAGAAKAAGIRTDRSVWIVLIIAAVLASFAGILYAGHLGSVAASQGNGMIFDTFAAAVIGGVSMDGGRGSLFGALTGVLTLKLIGNVLSFGGVGADWIKFFDGAVILVALIISRYTSGTAQD